MRKQECRKKPLYCSENGNLKNSMISAQAKMISTSPMSSVLPILRFNQAAYIFL
jgi:hypothetical protein